MHLDPRQHHDLVTTVHFAVRRSRHFRPARGDDRDVWGNIPEHVGRSTAENIVAHILHSGWTVRPSAAAASGALPPAGWVVAWVRGWGVEFGAACPEDATPIAVGPRGLVGEAIANTARAAMAGHILPAAAGRTVGVPEYAAALLAELSRLVGLQGG